MSLMRGQDPKTWNTNSEKRDIVIGILENLKAPKAAPPTAEGTALNRLRKTMVMWKGTWERENAVGPFSKGANKIAIQIIEGVISEIDAASAEETKSE